MSWKKTDQLVLGSVVSWKVLFSATSCWQMKSTVLLPRRRLLSWKQCRSGKLLLVAYATRCRILFSYWQRRTRLSRKELTPYRKLNRIVSCLRCSSITPTSMTSLKLLAGPPRSSQTMSNRFFLVSRLSNYSRQSEKFL